MLKRIWMLALLLVAGSALAQEAPAVTLTPFVENISRPVGIVNAADGSDRLFIVTQGGPIYVIQDGEQSTFLDLTARISGDVNEGGYTERGVLGLVFSPTFAEDGRFYVNYSGPQGETIVSRFTVLADDPNQGDLDSEEVLLEVAQPFPNHNGGAMAFGPDGYLYLSLGDGGAGGDPLGSGQKLDTLLGKILRLDVSGETGYTVPDSNPFVGINSAKPEIWAFGLRNVWRFSFDRDTGDFWLADVGQGEMEEVNFQPADSQGGENYGWSAFEGTLVYNDAINAPNAVLPVLEYRHGDDGCSITGGYVYRGTAIPDLVGQYLYGDFCSGKIWAASPHEDGTWTTTVLLNADFPVSSFGEDEAGELYVANHDGTVYQFTAK